MRHKIPALIFFTLSVILAGTAVVLGFRTWGGAGGTEQAAQPGPTAAVSDIYTTPAPTAEPTPEPTPESTPEPTAVPEPTATPWAGPMVAEQEGLMGPDYFANAAFLGNSVTSGLWLYNNENLLPSDTTHWYCADSLTILGAAPYAAQMPANTFGKVYIGFGINEVNYQKETLRAAFVNVIDQVKASQPGAIIYLMSVTPVSKYCDENKEFKRSAVQSFNQMLQDIAREQQVWYLDVYPVLCGEDGYLPSEVTPDGVHFTPAHYQKWFEYMKTHYVPDGTPAVEPTEAPSPEPEAGG